MPDETPRRLLHSIPEARRILGDVGNTHLYQLIGAGLLGGVKMGRRTFITTESLEAYARSLPPASINMSLKRAA